MLLVLGLLLLAPAGARADQDVLKQARSAATRSESLRILEQHLATAPRDVDARLLYGQYLSWEGRYDEARRELERVLAEAPAYTDARAALMNVEWWSGRYDAARALSDAILVSDPGHVQARLVRQRLDARDRPWSGGVSASFDTFSDDRDGWHEQMVTISRQTSAGSVVVRGSRADRFGLDDQQIELEFYPVFRPGTYAFVGVGAAGDHTLYPKQRLAFDLYQTVARGVEVSGGYRRLGFTSPVNVYVGSGTLYRGMWMFTGRLHFVTVRDRDGETSVQLQARRYFGALGTSFVGAGYTRGLTRDEIRGAGDVASGGIDGVGAELSMQATPRLRVQASGRTTRDARAAGATLWQHTLGAGLSVRF